MTQEANEQTTNTEVTTNQEGTTENVEPQVNGEQGSEANIADGKNGDERTASEEQVSKEPEQPSLLGNKEKISKLQGLVKDAGLIPADIAREITDNDGEVSPETLKALVEKHGEAVGTLIAEKLTTLHQENVNAAKQRDESVFNQVAEAFKGVTEQTGEESWKELSGWAKDNIPNEQRKEINELLGKGGLQAQLAVAYVIDQFKNSDDFQQPAVLETGDDTPKDFSSGAIDKQTYITELNKLLDAGHDYNTSQEIRKLEARRLKGVQRGL